MHQTTTSSGTVPSLTLNDGHTHPAAWVSASSRSTGRDAAAVHGARGRLPPHRHRRDVRQRAAKSGKAIRDAGLDRDECSSPASSTTAITGPTTPAGVRRHVGRLGFDYVDLFLIHWPLPTLYGGDFVSTWKMLEEFAGDGARGRSACRTSRSQHLQRRLAGGARRPAVNQIELHPYLLNDEVRAYDRRARHRHRGVVADRAGRGARRPGRSPRSPRARPDAGPGRAALAHPARQHRVSEVGDAGADQENFEVFDFELDRDDMDAITALDRGEAGEPDRTRTAFDYIPD